MFPSALPIKQEYSLKCCFTSTETVGLLGTGAQDVHLDFHRAPELLKQEYSLTKGSLSTMERGHQMDG